MSLYLSICGFGVVLNGIQIAVLLYQKKTKVPFDLSLISLAMADFLASLLPMILHLFPFRSLVYLIIMGDIYYASCMTSSFMLGFIAFQRLIAVRYPHRYTVLLTRKRCIITICLMWLVSCLLILPVFFRRGSFYDIIYLHIPWLAGAVIVVCYAMLNYQLLKQRNRSVVDQSWNRHRKILVYSTIVSFVFLLSTIPFTFSVMYLPTHHPFVNVATYVYIFHVIFNPLLYFVVQYLNLRRLCRQVSDTETVVQRTNVKHIFKEGQTVNVEGNLK